MRSRNADDFIIRYRAWGPWREAHRHMAEKTVADIVTVVRAVEPTCQPLAVSFPHGPEGGPCALASLVSVVPAYGAPCTEVVLPAAVMNKPLPTANRSLFRLSEKWIWRCGRDLAVEDDLGHIGVGQCGATGAEGVCDRQSVARLLGCGGLPRVACSSWCAMVDDIRGEGGRALGERMSDAEVWRLVTRNRRVPARLRRWYGRARKPWS
jgi:hypothetical protein